MAQGGMLVLHAVERCGCRKRSPVVVAVARLRRSDCVGPAAQTRRSEVHATETSVTVPRVVVPSRNVTVPVILPATLALPLTFGRTMAVKVTAWPKEMGSWSL